jgi:hypothetical protein
MDDVANFFEGSLQALQARNLGIEAAFRRLDANRFTAVAYRDGEALSRCKITPGGLFGRGNRSLTATRTYDGSINESLTVRADDQSLYLQALGMPMSRGAGCTSVGLEDAIRSAQELLGGSALRSGNGTSHGPLKRPHRGLRGRCRTKRNDRKLRHFNARTKCELLCRFCVS